jgi:capsular polysaccharide biosynthesis protein
MDQLKDRFEEEAGIIDWISIIYKRRKIAMISFLISISIASYYLYYTAKTEKPIYTSRTMISLGPQMLEVTTTTGDIIKRKYSLTDEITLLESSLVAQQAAKVLKNKFGYKESEDKLVDIVKGSVNVKTKKSKLGQVENTVEISASTRDPKEAFDIITALLEGYRNQKDEEETVFIKNAQDAFNSQVKASYEELLKAENTLAEFIQQNEKIIGSIEKFEMSDLEDKDVISAAPGKKAVELKSKVSEAQSFLKAVRELAERNKVAALSMIARKYNNLVNINLKDMLLEKEKELNEALLINEEIHPDVIKARSNVDVLKQKIDAEILDAIYEIEAEFNDLISQENELAKLMQSDLTEKLITYNMLKKDILLKRNIYNSISQTLKQLDIGENMKRYSETRVLEPPRISYEQTNKIPTQKIALSILAALFISWSSVYITETIDKSIQNIDQLEKLINLPVLATIPAYHHKRQKSEAEQQEAEGRPVQKPRQEPKQEREETGHGR